MVNLILYRYSISSLYIALGLLATLMFLPLRSVVAEDMLISRDEFIRRLGKEPAQSDDLQTRNIGEVAARQQSDESAADTVPVTIRFVSNSVELADSFSRRQLRELAESLSSGALSDYAFEIGGHTDSKGDDAYNLKLSARRAQAVRDILCGQYEVDCTKLSARGYGETQPVASNKTKAGQAKNRRITLKRLDTVTPTVTTSVATTVANTTHLPSLPAHTSPEYPNTTNATPVQDCDRLAAHPLDPAKVAPGVPDDKLQIEPAIAACTEAVQKYPQIPRFAFQLARIHEYAKEKDEMVKWERIAAEAGYPIAQFSYAGSFIEGTGGIPQDLTIAAQWMRKAAEQGLVIAQSYMAIIYYVGDQGVPKDMAQAFKWAQKAASQGDASSQFLLYNLYANGDGTAKNDELAIQWLQRAANQGEPDAVKMLQVMKPLGLMEKLEDELVRLYKQLTHLTDANKFAEAIPVQQRILEIKEQVSGPNDLRLVNDLQVLDALYQKPVR